MFSTANISRYTVISIYKFTIANYKTLKTWLLVLNCTTKYVYSYLFEDPELQVPGGSNKESPIV